MSGEAGASEDSEVARPIILVLWPCADARWRLGVEQHMGLRRKGGGQLQAAKRINAKGEQQQL